MRFAEQLYRSPLGRMISALGTGFARFHKPFMVYGYRDAASGTFRKYARMSSSVVIMSPDNLAVEDHVWVWHYSILDATEGITIGEGCQIGAWVGIFTHGSESSIRLLGRQFVHIPNSERHGYTRGKVSIGPYSFVAAGSAILPGVTIGEGCLIGAGTLVNKDIPDHSIVTGWPGEVRGSTLTLDAKHFKQYDYSSTYYNPSLVPLVHPTGDAV